MLINAGLESWTQGTFIVRKARMGSKAAGVKALATPQLILHPVAEPWKQESF